MSLVHVRNKETNPRRVLLYLKPCIDTNKVYYENKGLPFSFVISGIGVHAKAFVLMFVYFSLSIHVVILPCIWNIFMYGSCIHVYMYIMPGT